MTGMRAKDAAAPQPIGQEGVSPYAWYVLAILFLVYVLNFIDRQILAILAEDIKRDLNLTDADIGFLFARRSAFFTRCSASRSGGWPTAGIACD